MPRTTCVAAIAVALAATAVHAQTAPSPSSTPAAPDWTITVGVEGRVQPDFEGSNRYEILPYPIINIRKAGTPRDFTSPRDGFSVAVVNLGQFRFGPTAKLGLPRLQKDDPALAGLGDVPWRIEVGGFAEFWPVQWLRTRAEVRQGLSGHHGIVSDLTADVVVPATDILTLSAGPRLSLATSEALQPYFGVTPAQSLTSGLPIYDPKGGTKAAGFGAQARQQWTPRWATNAYLEYDRLLGDVANSPILARNGSPNQITVGLGLSYTFDVGGLGF